MKSESRITGRGSFLSALAYSGYKALQLDTSRLTAIQAVRGAIGFTIPLAIGLASGHIVEGVSIASGAMSMASIGLTFTYGARLRTMLFVCLALAFSAFVGSITSHYDWLVILIIGLWGLGAGMLIALGSSAMVVGLQATLYLIIMSHFHLTPIQALLQALLMLLGAILQTLIAFIPIPGQQTRPERIALNELYAFLSIYANDPENEQHGNQMRKKLLNVQTILIDQKNEKHQTALSLRLLEEAEHLRLSILVLRRTRRLLHSKNKNVKDLDSILNATAQQCLQIAQQLTNSPPTIEKPSDQNHLATILTILQEKQAYSTNSDSESLILYYGKTIQKQLHTAERLAISHGSRRFHLSHHYTALKLHKHQLSSSWSILRVNMKFNSFVFRHAIRLSVALLLASVLYRLTPLTFQHGYWIPITTLFVLRQDFSTTFSRGFARMAGTMIGAFLVSLLISFLAPSGGFLILLGSISFYLAMTTLFANYTLFSMLTTITVVILLAFITPREADLMAAINRVTCTAIGGGLALLIYLLWPTWGHVQLLGNISDYLEMLRRYLITTLTTYINPSTYNTHHSQHLRMEARLARSNAEASMEHVQHELVTRRHDLDLPEGLLNEIYHLAQSTLALEAYLLDRLTKTPIPEMTAFSRAINQALINLVEALRDGKQEVTIPDIDQPLSNLRQSSKAKADFAYVLVEAKQIVRSVKFITQLLTSEQEKQ